jgi:DNA mismatch repair protein MutH
MNMKISIDEAILKLQQLEGKRFAELVTPDLINKGSAGQLIELALGLVLSSDLLDLSDGELKSNKFLKGKPAETMAITQVGHTLPEISEKTPWENSRVLKKISSFILVPVHKDRPDPADWVIGKATHFEKNKFPSQYEKLAADYLDIAEQLREILSNGGELHTLNGRNQYLQIRTKDSKDAKGSYHPIKYGGRAISNKNYAFYFRKQFLADVLK